jgi:large subunit ribosomal protein L31
MSLDGQFLGDKMKKEIHPSYQEVLFVDSSTGTKFLCGSTLQTTEREVFEGKEYPVYRIPVSSASHPAYTGSMQFLDSEGRVDKFFKRYGGKKKDEGSSGKDQPGQEKPKDQGNSKK